MSDSLQTQGYAIIQQVVDQATCQTINSELSQIKTTKSHKRGSLRGGMRGVLKHSQTAQAVIDSQTIQQIIQSHLGPNAFPVRSIFFDKTPDANWLVPWHQDTTIAVEQQIETSGYGPWSFKNGSAHVQPPAEVLNNMLTIRIHTDPCSIENGPLRVLPGSHQAGIQSARPEKIEPIQCIVDQGDAVLMKPLTWHASSKAKSPKHRRVLHVEWANQKLPEPLKWAFNSI